jgi:hypothetical protein
MVSPAIGHYRRGEVIAMRRWLWFAVLLIFSVGASAMIPLCEYRSPLTNLSDLTLSFTYQYHNDPYGLEDRDINTGDLGVDYVRLYDSPEYGFNVSLKNDMEISAIDISTYTTRAEGDYKRYFASEQASFAYAGVSARSSSSFQALGLSFDLGAGYGRFTDVTPLAKAIQIDEYLVKRGSLSDHLHPVDLQILALEIGSAATYDTVADLLAVVQEIIESSGLVRAGGLDALDISEITRLIQEAGFSRFCGWDVKLGLGYELLDPSGGGNDLLITGSFNYAFSTTPKMQILLQGSFAGPPEITQTNRIDFTVAYDYLISEFLTLTGAYDFSRETWVAEPTDIHQFTLDLVLTPLETADVVLGVVIEHRPYYLEWNVDIKLAIQMELL